MYYSTRVMAIDCHNNTTGWQAELIRCVNGDCIEGAIWHSKAAAQAEAATMLAAAADLFEAKDEQ